MKRGLGLAAVLWLGAAAMPPAASAQSAADVLAQGVRAYGDLELDGAAALLRRALAFEGPAALAPNDATRALIYLTATELFRDRRDTAAAIARRLVLHDPRFRPDELVFPPAVLTLFDQIRRATPAVTARAPDDTAFRPGTGALVVRLHASTFHDVAAVLAAEDGRVIRGLYSGPMGDSLDLRWNGLDTTGARVPDGRYAVTVSSLDAGRRAVRIVRLPVEVALRRVDTLPHPAPPAESLLRAEREPVGPALRALAPWAVTGVGIAVLPGVVAGGEDVSAGRFVVAGAVSISGLVAFFSRHPGRVSPANAAHNTALRQAWRRAVDSVEAVNATRQGDSRLVVRAGRPVILTPTAP